MEFKKITKTQVKHIRLLQAKKYRQKYDQFIVEGLKSVNEFMHSSLECVSLFGTISLLNDIKADNIEKFQVNNKELQQISNFKNPQGLIGLFKMPKSKSVNTKAPFILALDDMRDPGNLGTVIRTAEWFGLQEIVCSTTCVDAFNPKVIQASMGSLSRIHVHYLDLPHFINENTDYDIVLADMDGTPYQNYSWTKDVLVIGNEANGIGGYLKEIKHNKVTIARKGKTESLNAAVSAAIIMAKVLG